MKRTLQPVWAVAFLLMQTAVFAQSNFDCSTNLYQVVNGRDLKLMDPSTGIYTDLGSASVSYNGAGFNYEDGYIYGISSGSLVRIDNTGAATDLGTISGFNAISYSADLDTLGNWHSFYTKSGSWKMTRIDVSNASPTAEEFPVTVVSGVATPEVCADIAYNPVTGKFYGMRSGRLHEFDQVNRTARVIADYSATTSPGAYGAAWSDRQGNTYFFNNGTGNVYRASFDNAGNVLSFGFTATSQPNGSNDGMSCPLAAPPVFPEICDNGLDDDGDGLVDCNDPDCTSTVSCGVSGVMFSTDFACQESIVTYHAFFTNNSSITNTITVTDVLPTGFIFLQDTLDFDAGGSSDFNLQPVEGDRGTLQWGSITLEGGETVRISYDVTVDNTAASGTNTNSVTLSLGNSGTISDPVTLSSDVIISSCPTPNTFQCEPAFYQVYKKRGKNQPNVYGKLDPITGDYDPIAIASDFANGLGYDINTGLVYGASGKKFIRLDEDGFVLDQGISFSKKVYRGDINESSEWYGVVGSDMVKINVSGTPVIVATYPGQGLVGWDIAYNMDGHFYSVHQGQLYKFNTSTNTKSTVAALTGIGIPTSGGYGAQWTGSDGYLYASHNSSGSILRVDVTTGEARRVSSSVAELSKNDGFSCPLDIPAVYEFDYGDNSRLPQSRVLSYKQDLSNDGLPDYATVWLGNTVEYNTTDPANADADGDTDDGVSMNTRIANGQLTANIGLNSNENLTLYYGIGVDWNDDGTFDEVINGSTDISGATPLAQTLTPPANFITGLVNVRVVVSEVAIDQSNISGDIVAMGEVEDYRFLITSDEDCTNGIDDDADGLTDCDDPDCSGVSGCPETPSGPGGNDGGLESHNRLAGKIAKVQFAKNREQKVNYNNKAELRKIGRSKQYGKSSPRGRIGSGSIEQFIPLEVLPGTESFVTSPEHLVGITNAEEVFSVDVFEEDTRVATVLAMTSVDGVYEHTKYVCDRLNGSELLDILAYKIDDEHDFQVVKLRLPNGATEYATSFSVKEDGSDKFAVESHWNLAFYPPATDYYNFQVWANNTSRLVDLVNETLRLLKVQRPIEAYNISEAPGVFVNKAEMTSGQLNLTFTNRTSSTTLNADGLLSETETSGTREFNQSITLDGATKENISLSLGSVYDLGLTFHDEKNTMPDVIFIADGAWGMDYDPAQEEVSSFIVDPGFSDDQNVYGLERNVHIMGGVKNSVAVFRSFNPSFRPTDLSNYSVLSFKARGKGTVEVTLVKSGTRDWADQPHATITLGEEEEQFNLDRSSFYDSSNLSQEWDDLTMVVFDVKGDEEELDNFEMRVSGVAFRQSQVTSIDDLLASQDFNVYPNPVNDVMNVSFTAKTSGEFSMELLSPGGKSTRIYNGMTRIGRNEIQFSDLPQNKGLYFYIMKLADDTTFQGKVLLTGN